MPTLALIIVFWAVAIRLWTVDGPKVPVLFIMIWILAFFGFPLLGLTAPLFMAFEAMLIAILLMVERYKSAM